MIRRVVAALVILAAVAPAAADPAPACVPPAPNTAPDLSAPLHLPSDSVIQTDGGSILRVPPGRYLREDLWTRLDAETKRLQDAETRLTATNASLRATLGGWQPGWWTVLAIATGGVGAGWWLHGKL